VIHATRGTEMPDYRRDARSACAGWRPTARLLVAGALAALAVPGVVDGRMPDRGATAPQAAGAAQSLSIGDMRVQRRAPGGRVRGSVAVSPAGTALVVVVRRGGRRIGRRTLTTSARARTRFSVRLDRASRARLRRVGHLDVQVQATVSGPGTRVSTGRSARVTR
jgi:hypothetical protein